MEPRFGEKSTNAYLQPLPLTYHPNIFTKADTESASIGSSVSSLSGKPELHLEAPTPECTTKACLTVFGSFLAMFCTFGQINSNGTFQSWYTGHQLSALPQSTIAWICSIQIWMFFFAGWPVGILFDRFGPKPLLITGSALHILSIVMVSISTRYWHFILAHGILFGLGVALVFYPALSATATHFTRYRASALGITASGSGVGGIIYPLFLRHVLPKFGFAWAVRLSGIFSVVFCVIAIFTISNHPSKVSRKNSQLFGQIRWETVRDRPFVLMSASCFMVALGLYIPFFYVANYAQSVGVAPALSFYTISVLNAGSVIGRITPAFAADRLGRFNILAPSILIGSGSCFFLWMFARSTGMVITFAAVYGFASGAFISLITPCVVQISKVEHIGSRIGALYTLISFPSLVGGPLAGWLLTRASSHGSPYIGMIAFSGSTLLCGACLMICTKLSINPRVSHVV